MNDLQEERSQKNMYFLNFFYVHTFLALCIGYIYGEDFEEDYFFGRSRAKLRSIFSAEACKNDLYNFLCTLRCPNKSQCIKNHCFCVDDENRVTKAAPSKFYPRSRNNDGAPGYIDFTLDEREDKPVLRHHIAHFCPNLDDARTCIRTCMKVGKPAFCGKDHVCYCGHRYNKLTKDDSVDSAAMYAQFKDLYKKYFGDNFTPEEIGV